MHLKSLTLKGFKSFASPTTFAFEPGVTCVVGPNGSGKSNVVDALAWVMGEQGVKSLRGGTMADVIFAGTSTRGPLGRAQVVLTIDNSDGALPIDYAEVTISRTLFRNGGSEYAINGEGCRLLDVQELLSDSGLGREMHVIVGQGQLDAVLRATPEERRGFVEEAAGILKHRRRKEKTLRKLDAMQANLTRLSDLAGEIRRQLKPLGRQAEVAREAQTIAAVVRDAKARLLADEVVGLRDVLARQSSSEAERRSERNVLQEQLDQAKAREQRLEQQMVGDAVDEARRVAFGLESVEERLRGTSSLARQRLQLLAEQSDQPELPSTVSAGMIADARDEAERLQGGVAQGEQALADARAATVAARAVLEALDDEIAAQSALVSRHDLVLGQLRGALEVAQSRLAAVRGEVLRQGAAREAAVARRDAGRAELAQLEEERAGASAGDAHNDADDADDSADGAGDVADGAGGDPVDHEAVRAEAERASLELQAEVDDLRDRLHTAERERDALAARRGALTMALDRADGTTALVAAERPGVRGAVAEHVQVRPGYEAAVAAALGSVVDSVLVDDLDAAFAAVAHATDAELGRVEVVVATPERVLPVLDVELPPGAVTASSVVDAPPGVLGLLASTVVADDLPTARAAWAALAAHPLPVTVITRSGEVLTDFVLRGGSGVERSRLELVAERDAAAERLGEVEAEVARLSALHSTAEEALASSRAEAAEAARSAREQAAEAARSAAEAARLAREQQAAVAAAEQQLARLRAQVDAAEAEEARLGESLAAAEQGAVTAQAAVDEARAGLDAHASRPRPILDASARDGVLAELEQARAAEIERRVQLETIRERVRAEAARAVDLQRQLDEQRAAADEHARRTVVRQREMRRTSGVLAALPAVLDAVGRSLAEARRELARQEAARTQQNEELMTLRRDERALRERLHGVTENVHGLEMEIYEKKLHLGQLLERAASELGLDDEVLVAEYGPDVLVPVPGAGAGAGASSADGPDGGPDGAAAEGTPYDRAEQTARLEAASRKLAQLGRVNPLALEEFSALEQRHAFLTEQLADLTRTRRDLLAIIDEIDEKMQTVFASAFADTQAAFDRVFPVLFPGGSGSLLLTDPDDLLTTGIEVSVRPAGKKIERLSLLSGGERSLAAVALLIAIFKARPSPFYIMDEVEAALDDANLGRLLAIFEDLRETSQLIVITHQKRTMEIADALYGVSMRQDGVSAVVGQRVVTDRTTSDRAVGQGAEAPAQAPTGASS
ncbi:chromosome segregation protein SMC [Frigoribacterium sp. PvP032]|uniref:chromosome segregation protein SMC n=1 Tax=Frigoribacterium sp. PvP032 TaxID=2806589 RepID=UPI001AE4537A|nr:chromosome segregation protein SMC [Frigoribacterium sp. PvP032]MBP1190366.1 chromosome segregation protein [Frigoribacterium sp. PvP032]